MNSRPGGGSPPDPDAFDGGDDEIYLPFAGRRGHTAHGDGLPGEEDGDDVLVDDDFDEAGASAAVRMRPPPKELSRRDRREWHRLEVARINRAAQSVASRRPHPESTSWSGGFIKNPPRGLGRKGRKAWLAAEQEATTQWWAQRRASNRDLDARMAGAAVLALVIGIAVIAALVVHHSNPAGPSSTTATSLPSMNTSTSASAAAPVASAPVVPGATGSVRVATGNAAVGVTPTLAPPVSGRWQPTPAGGVPPITPPTPATLDPATVPLLAPVTGPVTAADQGSARAVVTSWLARTCPSSWRDPFGTDLLRGRALETAAAWKVDDPARDTVGAALWRSEAVAHQQTRRCGNLVVTVSPDQPLTAHGGFVLFSADRVVTSAFGHLPPAVEHISGARRVVATGGKWLVDIAVVGG